MGFGTHQGAAWIAKIAKKRVVVEKVEHEQVLQRFNLIITSHDTYYPFGTATDLVRKKSYKLSNYIILYNYL